MNVRIAFFDTKPYDRKIFDEMNQKYGFEIKYFKERLNEDTVPLTKGFPVVCLFVNDEVTPEMVKQLEENGVKLIALRCAGYNNIPLKSVYQHINVVRVPAYSPYAVAEHAMALILTLNRKTHRAHFRVRENNFTLNGLMGFDLHQKTAGVIGTGKIGREMIKILKGFSMDVLAYDVYPDEKNASEIGFRYTDLDEIYRKSDVISLHCPLTKETEYLIDKESIGKMKNDVMLINTSRGKLIDTKALIDGLKNHQIGYAGLDVYEEENEYFFEDFSDEVISDDVLARLQTFPNVLITSHQAFFTKEALNNISGTTLKSIKDFVMDQALEHEICYFCGENPADCKKMKKGRCF